MAALEEEKKAAQIERESLIANYQQHLQIEKEQQESKRKVRVCIGKVYTCFHVNSTSALLYGWHAL